MKAQYPLLTVIAGGLSLVLVACERQQKQPDATKSGAAQQTPSAQKKTSSPSPTAADPAQDHPATPQWLPMPDELPGWIRTSNTQVSYAGNWDLPGHKELEDGLGAFRVRSAVDLQYQSVAPNPRGIVVDVMIFEAYHSDDAFGVFTGLMTEPIDQTVGSMSSFASGAEGVRICWQNKHVFYVCATSPGDETHRVIVDRLIAGLVEPIPSTDPPELTNFMPTAGRLPGKLWVVRKHLNTLPEEVLKDVLNDKGVQTTQALGLTMDTLAVVAAFSVGPDERPNYVWLVRYPTAEAAQRAYTAYDNWRQRQTPQPLISIEKPAGQFLCGSWTLDQESLIPVVPGIVSKLPK